MIIEELEEIDLCDALEKGTLVIGDVYKVFGGKRYKMQYFWANKTYPLKDPNLFGVFIKPRQGRNVVSLKSISPKRMRGGKGYFLNRERLASLKFFIVHKQTNSDTGEVYYDRASRFKEEQ